jgi:hypothetical protein
LAGTGPAFRPATHYRTAILPTCTRKPRDKVKFEIAVLVVERWILARLRTGRFFSLAELNQAIAELVADLNARPMRRLGVSRPGSRTELEKLSNEAKGKGTSSEPARPKVPMRRAARTAL